MTTRSLLWRVAVTIGATEVTTAKTFFRRRLQTALMPPLLLLLLTAATTTPPVTLASPASEGGGGNAATSAGAISPVRHLPESLAASSAAGTVVAVWCGGRGGDGGDDGDPTAEGTGEGEECVVILSRSSPSSRRSNLTLTTSSAATTLRSLEPSSSRNESETRSDDEASLLIPLPNSGPITDSLQLLHPHCLLCATGLSADVVHLVRTAASASSRHAALFSSPIPLETVVVDSLARRMGNAASSGGGEGRPFGVQCLAVGVGRAGGRRGGRMLRVYTVDPSGGYRSWGGLGTAIGRRADEVRRNLWSIGSAGVTASSSSSSSDGGNGGEGDDDGGEKKDIGTDNGDGPGTREGDDVATTPPSPSPPPSRPRDAGEGLEVAMAAMLMLLDDDDLNSAAAEAEDEDEASSDEASPGADLFDAVAMRAPRDPSSSSSSSSPFGIVLAPSSGSSGTFLFHPRRVEETYRSCLRRIVEERRRKKREERGRKRTRRRKGWRA